MQHQQFSWYLHQVADKKLLYYKLSLNQHLCIVFSISKTNLLPQAHVQAVLGEEEVDEVRHDHGESGTASCHEAVD